MLATREDLQGAARNEIWEREATAHDGASKCELSSPRVRRSPSQSRRNAMLVVGSGLLVNGPVTPMSAVAGPTWPSIAALVTEQLLAYHQARAQEAARHSRLIRSVTAARPRSARARFSWLLRLAAVVALGVTLVRYTDANAVFDSSPSRPGVSTESVTLVGLTPLGVERVTYEAGASREWAADEKSWLWQSWPER